MSIQGAGKRASVYGAASCVRVAKAILAFAFAAVVAIGVFGCAKTSSSDSGGDFSAITKNRFDLASNIDISAGDGDDAAAENLLESLKGATFESTGHGLGNDAWTIIKAFDEDGGELCVLAVDSARNVEVTVDGESRTYRMR